MLLLLAQHRSPTEMAEWLLYSCSSVYEVAARWKPERIEATEEIGSDLVLAPSLRRSLLALLRKSPIMEGGCRTRWSCATPALSLEARPPHRTVFGDRHDEVTLNHRRKHLRDSAADVRRHLDRSGPWRYQLSKIYQEPEISECPKLLSIAHNSNERLAKSESWRRVE